MIRFIAWLSAILQQQRCGRGVFLSMSELRNLKNYRSHSSSALDLPGVATPILSGGAAPRARPLACRLAAFATRLAMLGVNRRSPN